MGAVGSMTQGGKELSKLSVLEVTQIVKGMGEAFEPYEAGIIKNGINGSIFTADLPEDEVAEIFDLIGVKLKVHRRLIINHFTDMPKGGGSVAAVASDFNTSSVPASTLSSASSVFGSSSLSWAQLTLSDDKKNAVLGKGKFGVVVKARLTSTTLPTSPSAAASSSSSSSLFQSDVAVKVLLPEPGPNSDRDYEILKVSVENEIKIMKEIESKLLFQSENIVKFLGVSEGDLPLSFQSEFGTKKALGIVMRLEAGGTLANFLAATRGLRLVDKLHLVLQLSRGLAELHEIQVIHGDIKPQNMLLSHHNPPFVRLGDFGQSTFSSSNKSSLGVSSLKRTFSKHGTPVYSAPELLLVDVVSGTRAKPSRRSDVYSLSLVVYEIMCDIHRPPYHDIVDEQQLVEQVARRGRRPPMSATSADTPSSISKIIELGWQKERSLRPSALEFYTTADQCFNVVSSNMFDIFLSHPWVKKSVMRHIKRYFTSIGYKTFYDQDNMQWDVKRSMEEGILRSKVVLACISRDYEKSRNCMFELSEASKLAGKPIVTLSTDADPFSWAGSDRQFGDLKQLCDINGQGKMFFDIGDICSRTEWNEMNESSIPKELINELHLKLSGLVMYLRGSHINCVPSLSSSGSTIDALYESKLKADIEAEKKRNAGQDSDTQFLEDKEKKLVSRTPPSLQDPDPQFLEDKEKKLVSRTTLSLQDPDPQFLEDKEKKLLSRTPPPLQDPDPQFLEDKEKKLLSGTTLSLQNPDPSNAKAEIEAEKKRNAALQITSAAEAHQYLCKFDNNFDILALGGEALVVSQLASINALQDGNKAFNEDLVRLGAFEQLTRILRLVFLSQKDCVLAKMYCIISFLCRYDGKTYATNMDSHLVRLAQCGLIELAVSSLTNRIKRPIIVKHVCMAVHNMACNDTNAAKLGSLGCCEQLVRVLIIHQDDKDVSEEACSAIGNMANNDANTIKLGSLGCCEQLVRVLTIHQNDEDLSKAACSAIYNMAFNYPNRVNLGSLGCCEQLVRVLTIHQNDRGVSRWACNAVGNMACYDSNRDKLGSSGCCEQLVLILTIHQDDEDVSNYASQAISNMASNSSCKSKFNSLNCSAILNTVRVRHKNSNQVSTEARDALSKLK